MYSRINLLSITLSAKLLYCFQHYLCKNVYIYLCKHSHLHIHKHKYINIYIYTPHPAKRRLCPTPPRENYQNLWGAAGQSWFQSIVIRKVQGRIQFCPINICFNHKSVDLRIFLPHPAPWIFPLPRPTPWPKSSAPCIPGFVPLRFFVVVFSNNLSRPVGESIFWGGGLVDLRTPQSEEDPLL